MRRGIHIMNSTTINTGLQDLFACLSFPSVSTDSKHKADLRNCADWIVGNFEAGIRLNQVLLEELAR